MRSFRARLPAHWRGLGARSRPQVGPRRRHHRAVLCAPDGRPYGLRQLAWSATNGPRSRSGLPPDRLFGAGGTRRSLRGPRARPEAPPGCRRGDAGGSHEHQDHPQPVRARRHRSCPRSAVASDSCLPGTDRGHVPEPRAGHHRRRLRPGARTLRGLSRCRALPGRRGLRARGCLGCHHAGGAGLQAPTLRLRDQLAGDVGRAPALGSGVRPAGPGPRAPASVVPAARDRPRQPRFQARYGRPGTFGAFPAFTAVSPPVAGVLRAVPPAVQPAPVRGLGRRRGVPLSGFGSPVRLSFLFLAGIGRGGLGPSPAAPSLAVWWPGRGPGVCPGGGGCPGWRPRPPVPGRRPALAFSRPHGWRRWDSNPRTS